jgi:nicotinamide mononucleotide adenylyltransferase
MEKLHVIIGRFQTNKLHEGHKELIRAAKATGNDVLILIGCTDAAGTDKNPLDFETRKHLFNTYFNNTLIKPLYDTPSNKDWSDSIDNIIDELGYKEAVIWGGRDNNIENYYSGKHSIKIINQVGNHSATKIRKEIKQKAIDCPNFRAGIIYHIENNYNKFLNIKIAREIGGDPYYYAERLGRDSIAFILYNKKTNLYGITREFKPPINQFLNTAFGGSIDSNNCLLDIAKQEVLEEAGYKDAKMISLGKVFVSTQMNQFCYLYVSDITDAKFHGRQPQNKTEAASSVIWLNEEEIIKTEDWKATTILTKFLLIKSK